MSLSISQKRGVIEAENKLHHTLPRQVTRYIVYLRYAKKLTTRSEHAKLIFAPLVGLRGRERGRWGEEGAGGEGASRQRLHYRRVNSLCKTANWIKGRIVGARRRGARSHRRARFHLRTKIYLVSTTWDNKRLRLRTSRGQKRSLRRNLRYRRNRHLFSRFARSK